ncbi:MAG: 50S ribosomal protein L6 [Chloroflexi bacterium]|nr:50S ribosomal protein L6 [Chloroflexota bacterium]
MSRIGRMPIPIPAGVEFSIEGQVVSVRGPKGYLTRTLHRDIGVAMQDGNIVVTRSSDSKLQRSLHGLTRTLVANMVVGVTQGFRKELEITGVGYRAIKEGDALVLHLGYSHPVRLTPPAGIAYVADTPTRVAVVGIDKELVGEQAAKIRAVREPEPYKGKGVRYQGERIRRKAGKAGKVGGKK